MLNCCRHTKNIFFSSEAWMTSLLCHRKLPHQFVSVDIDRNVVHLYILLMVMTGLNVTFFITSSLGTSYFNPHGLVFRYCRSWNVIWLANFEHPVSSTLVSTGVKSFHMFTPAVLLCFAVFIVRFCFADIRFLVQKLSQLVNLFFIRLRRRYLSTERWSLYTS